jgi:serine/threonine protein kinase/tetratricopeptide (TPR) repeat protein
MSRNQIPVSNVADAVTPDDAEVARVLDLYLAGIEAGRPADPERLLAEHPAIADELRACLDVMQFAECLADDGSGPGPVVADGSRIGPLLGDYRIVRQIGRGGMGIVYEAEQQSLKRRVALKVLPLAAAIDPRQLRRFHVEAQAAACLHHTHIVPVHAVGCERGMHYYAMQYIEGKSLAELIRELRQLEGRDAAEQSPTATLDVHQELASMLASGQLEPPRRTSGPAAPAGSPEVVPAALSQKPAAAGSHSSSASRTSAYFRTVANLGIQAAEALEHAHQEGVVHRDIKPANLMVDVKGHLWITDFGLARLQNDCGLTLSGDLVGTIRYMSPEQAIGQRAVLDQRTDIYSLGVTLYELVALEPAFSGGDRREVLRRIIEEDPRPLRALNPSVPRELETIVQKATTKEPGSRYMTAQDLADDLRRFLEYKPIKAKRPTLIERAGKWSRRHIAWVISAALVLCLAVIGLVISTAMVGAKQAEIVRQSNLAHRQEERARHVVDEMYTRLSERWLSQDPGDAELRREFLEKAAAYYEELARAPVTDRATRLEAAHSWLRVGQIGWTLRRTSVGVWAFKRAIELFADLADDSHGDSNEARDGQVYALIRIGDLLWAAAGRNAEAEVLYSRAVALARSIVEHHPEHLAGWFNLANAKLSLGDFLADDAALGEAEAILRKIISDLIERRTDVQPIVAQLLKHRLAVFIYNPRSITRAIESGTDPRQAMLPQMYARLGITLGSRGRHAEAVECLRVALSAPHQERSVRAVVLQMLAERRYSSGKYRECIHAFRESLELVPNAPQTLQNLADRLAKCPDPEFRDPREAVRVASRAVELSPTDGSAWRVLGEAHCSAGNWWAAAEAIEKSMELGTPGPYHWLRLAIAQSQLGNKDQARASFDKAVAWMEKNPRKNDDLARYRAEAAALLGLKDEPIIPNAAK